MAVQEVVDELLTPPSLAGAGFYILVFLVTEKLVKTWLGRGGRYGGFESLIRAEPPRGQESEFTETDQKVEQLKERYVYQCLNKALHTPDIDLQRQGAEGNKCQGQA